MLDGLKRWLSSRAVAAQEPAQEPASNEAADKLIVEGNRLEDAGDAASALALYRRAAESAPNHARAHLNVGIALAGIGDVEGAASAYQSVLDIDAGHAWGNYNFARLLFLQKELGRAEMLAREAIRSRPDFADALILLSNILDARGDAASAAEAAAEAVRLESRFGGGLAQSRDSSEVAATS